jgi:hypothetical protein
LKGVYEAEKSEDEKNTTKYTHPNPPLKRREQGSTRF